MHPYITESHDVKYERTDYFSLQFPHISSFLTIITNHFIGEEVCLGQASIDGYKAIGFDVM
jgi:hypothetical protein